MWICMCVCVHFNVNWPDMLPLLPDEMSFMRPELPFIEVLPPDADPGGGVVTENPQYTLCLCVVVCDVVQYGKP